MSKIPGSPCSEKADAIDCLNLIRIIAAVQVMFGHTVEHLKLPIDPTIFYATYFLRGVPIFFAISGYLMWFSIGRQKSYKQYLEKRFWRIYPELWVAVAIEVLVMVLLYRDWDWFSLILFTFGQSTLFQFWTPSCLRGYGVGVPNGALWTIGVIIQYYIVAWFFYKVMSAQRNWKKWAIGFIAAFLVSFGLDYIIHLLTKNVIIGKLYSQTIIKYFWLFYIGMFIAEFKEKMLPFLKQYWSAGLLIAFVFFWSRIDLYSGYYVGWSIFLVAGLIGFAYRYPKFNVNPDVSYGLFLYHMIVVNVFVNFNMTGEWLYFLLVFGFSLLLAYISTVTIGQLSQTKKKMVAERQAEK